MSDKRFHARQKAARAYQAAHPGTSYTRALRIVTNTPRRPLAAVLGYGRDGTAVTVNLESATHDGTGPHCTVIGTDAEHTRGMLSFLGASLAAHQQPGDLEIISCFYDLTEAVGSHTYWDIRQVGDLLDDYLIDRQRSLSRLQNADGAGRTGHKVPATLVLMETPPHDVVSSGKFERWTRVARSAGISIAVGLESPAAAAYLPEDPFGVKAIRRLLGEQVGVGAGANLSGTTLTHLGDSRGRLTVRDVTASGRRRGGCSTVFTMQPA